MNGRYGFEIIHREELEQILHRERVMIIDLREREKYEKEHLKFARNYSIYDMDKWKKTIPDEMSVVFYCEHGNKSLIAAKKMGRRKGRIYTILGGIE